MAEIAATVADAATMTGRCLRLSRRNVEVLLTSLMLPVLLMLLFVYLFGGAIETIPWEQRKPYDEFDYGYVLTVHKSQGSQWDDVVLFDESFAFQDSRARWLYTGITRAAKRLSVVV